MVERSQTEVWRLAPWLMVILLLGNFVLSAWDAQDSQTNQRVIRVWFQALANFIQSPVTSISSSVSNSFQSFANMRTAVTENDDLKQRIQGLEMQLQEKQTLSAENNRLKALLDFKASGKFDIISAKIIGRDPSVWFDSSVINRGSLDKIDLNMPVVTPEGLIGRVTAISPLTAQVTLITDDKSSAAAIVGELGKSEARGVVRGMNDRETLEMRYVPSTIEVTIGEPVYTTGQDGIYPPGLKIGDVMEVRPAVASASNLIIIRPVANIISLSEVAVLLYKPPPRERFDKALPNALSVEQTESER